MKAVRSDMFSNSYHRSDTKGVVAMGEKIRLLFLCTGNSCRSQMAEGLCRSLRGDVIEPYSAGLERHGLNPLAVRVMGEIGIDLAHHYSKTVEDLGQVDFEFIVTVCDHAHEACPIAPAGTKVTHRGFDDPPRLAATAGSEEEALVHYRRVRDEIKEYVMTLPMALYGASKTG